MRLSPEKLSKLAQSVFKPSGRNSFEELVSEILSNLTGTLYRLAKSGTQPGSDMAGVTSHGSVLVVECKRYLESTNLDQRELLGEIEQAHQFYPDLDLWVLATSGSLSAQDYSALSRAAEDRGVAFLAISASDGSPSSIDTFLTAGFEVFVRYLQSLSPVSVKGARKLKEQVEKHNAYGASLKRLSTELTPGLSGYDDYRKRSHSWLLEKLSSPAHSLHAFRQQIVIRGDAAKLVERTGLNVELDRWWHERLNWIKTDAYPIPPVSVIVGEEGDGKTWGVAGWVAKNVETANEFPIVAMVSANDCGSAVAAELLGRISTTLLDGSGSRLNKRFERWWRSDARRVSVLIVIDGLNQSFDWPHWQKLLLDLQLYAPHVAVILTARAGYWRPRASNFVPPAYQVWQLQPFDDKELARGLKLAGRALSDFPPNSHLLIRKPRYLALACHHHDKLADVGGLVTPAWLVYLDWKDRFSKAGGLLITDDEFQEILKGFVRKERIDHLGLALGDLTVNLPSQSINAQTYDEFLTGGIIEKAAQGLTLSEPQLVLGMGLLLLEVLTREAPSTEAIAEKLAAWLEPGKESDLKTSIIEVAALHALHPSNKISKPVKLQLLLAWLEAINAGEELPQRFSAYFHIDPDFYLDAIEEFSRKELSVWSSEVLLHTVVSAYDKKAHRQILENALNRWLLTFFPEGESWRRFDSEDERKTFVKSAEDEIGASLAGSAVIVGSWKMAVAAKPTTDRLTRFALEAVTHIDPRPFLSAVAAQLVCCIATGAFQRDDLIRWIVISSRTPIADEIDLLAQHLLRSKSWVMGRAAALLLRWEGGEQSRSQLAQLPAAYREPKRKYSKENQDPCLSFFSWSEEICMGCFRREDTPLNRVIRELKSRSVTPSFTVPNLARKRLVQAARNIDPHSVFQGRGRGQEEILLDDVTLPLARTDKKVLADIFCKVIGTVEKREGDNLKALCFHLGEWKILIGRRERLAFNRTWKRYRSTAPDMTDSQAQFIEAELFLYGISLLSPRQQLKRLVERDSKAGDLVDVWEEFKPIGDFKLIARLLAQLDDDVVLRRILWFLSKNPKSIPPKLLALLSAKAKRVGGFVFSVLIHLLLVNESAEAKRLFLSFDWTSLPGQDKHETHWGNIALATFGESLTIEELFRRVHPAYSGYVVAIRRFSRPDVLAYAEYVHNGWLILNARAGQPGVIVPPLQVEISPNEDGFSRPYYRPLAKGPSFFDWLSGVKESDQPADKRSSNEFVKVRDTQLERQQAEMKEALAQMHQVVDVWFDRGFRRDSLQALVKARPDLAELWVSGLTEDLRRSRGLLLSASDFYLRLCEVLFSTNPQLAVKLYRRLERHGDSVNVIYEDSGVRVIDELLFEAEMAGPEILELWDERLQVANTDEDYLRLSFLCKSKRARSWIRAKAASLVTSKLTWDVARGLVLLGAIGDDVSTKKLRSLRKRLDGSYLGEVASYSIQRAEMAKNANHWFQEYVAAKKADNAFAYFQLLLRCADVRAVRFVRSFENTRSSKKSNLHAYVHSCRHRLRSAIKENAKPWSDNFLGLPKGNDGLWPWSGIDA